MPLFGGHQSLPRTNLPSRTALTCGQADHDRLLKLLVVELESSREHRFDFGRFAATAHDSGKFFDQSASGRRAAEIRTMAQFMGELGSIVVRRSQDGRTNVVIRRVAL